MLPALNTSRLNISRLNISRLNISGMFVLKRYIKPLKLSSTACAIAGGTILAANMPLSRFGFIFLACSSGQLLLASLIGRDHTTTTYAGSLFIFVDCLGIYRWLLA